MNNPHRHWVGAWDVGGMTMEGNQLELYRRPPTPLRSLGYQVLYGFLRTCDGEPPRMKIGITGDIERRRKRLLRESRQNAPSAKLELVMLIRKVDKRIERQVHYALQRWRWRENGSQEWFTVELDMCGELALMMWELVPKLGSDWLESYVRAKPINWALKKWSLELMRRRFAEADAARGRRAA